MTILVENIASGTRGSPGTTIDVTFTITKANKLVTIQSAGNNGGLAGPTSVVWDVGGVAEALTQRVIQDAGNSDSRLTIYDLDNPTPGVSKTIRYTLGFSSIGNLHVIGLIDCANGPPSDTASIADTATDTVNHIGHGISVGAMSARQAGAPSETQGNTQIAATVVTDPGATNTGQTSNYHNGVVDVVETFGWTGTTGTAIAIAAYSPSTTGNQVMIFASKMKLFYNELKLGLKTHDELSEMYGELMTI